MKKLTVSLTLLTLLVLPLVATGQIGEVAQNENDVYITLNSAVNYLFAFLMIAAVLVIIMAAYGFLTAAGDPEKVAKARNYIVYALVAIVVGFLAKAIILVVGGMLDIQTGGTFF
ncbi:hypothetical protein KKC65_00845 [Patescibacteria group bacterium]|nr:hypothetical protein [Patescibacteria group bacterium]